MTYQKLNWLNKGEIGAIPINKTNLNHMDDGIAESNIFRNLFNVGNAKTTANTGLNFNKENNQILINGSSTKETNIFLDSTKANKDEEGIILKAGTYTATIKKVSGSLSGSDIDFYLRKSDGTSIYNGTTVFTQIIEAGVSDGTAYSSTFTLEEETRLHWMGYFGSNLRTFNNLVLQFQIEESTSATEYTPFAGYIVESGSNDNGSWIKYSDGTMICRNIFLIRDVTFTELATGINYSETQTITYPQEFIDNDVSVKVSCRSANFAWAVNEISIASSFQFDILQSTNVIRNISCSYIAIGRWK